MAAITFDLDTLLTPMSEETRAELFPTLQRKHPDFDKFQAKMNSLDVGSEWDATLPADADPVNAAKQFKFNFNEAAKARVAWKPIELTDEEQAQADANKRIDSFDRSDGTAVKRVKGKWVALMPEPVILNWRMLTRVEKVTETKDGVTTEKEVKIPTSLHFVVKATEAIRHRNRGGSNGTTETPAEPTTNGHVTEPVAEPVAA